MRVGGEEGAGGTRRPAETTEDPRGPRPRARTGPRPPPSNRGTRRPGGAIPLPDAPRARRARTIPLPDAPRARPAIALQDRAQLALPAPDTEAMRRQRRDLRTVGFLDPEHAMTVLERRNARDRARDQQAIAPARRPGSFPPAYR